MSLSLLDLPLELVDGIFRMLDDKSILKMREVSHITKGIAESVVLNHTHNPVVDGLWLIRKDDSAVGVTLNFTPDREEKHTLLPSKLFFVSATNYLRITGFDYIVEKMIATLTPAETVTFFDRLTPLMSRMQCNFLKLIPSTPEMFSLTSQFFDGKQVLELNFKLDDSKATQDFVLDLIPRLGSNALSPIVHVWPSDGFLEQLADMVDAISIIAAAQFKEEMRTFNVQHFASVVLRKRCSHLFMSAAFIEMSFVQVAALSTVLYNEIGDKPFFFCARTSEDIIIRENHLRRHIIQVLTGSITRDSRNLIDLKHSEMAKGYWC